jgi:hypothetical protein
MMVQSTGDRRQTVTGCTFPVRVTGPCHARPFLYEDVKTQGKSMNTLSARAVLQLWAHGEDRSRQPEVTTIAGEYHRTGGEGVLALVLAGVVLLVFAGCSAQTAVAAVAAGAVIAAEFQQRLS